VGKALTALPSNRGCLYNQASPKLSIPLRSISIPRDPATLVLSCNRSEKNVVWSESNTIAAQNNKTKDYSIRVM
jgi:hypothetical protein